MNIDGYSIDNSNISSQLKNKNRSAPTNFTINSGSYFQVMTMENNLISRGLWMLLAGITIYFVGVNLLNTDKDDTTIVNLARVTMGVALLTIAGSLVYFILSKVESTRNWKKLDEGKIFFDNQLGVWQTVMLGLHVITSVVLFIILTIFASLSAF
jgi:hypothetical protein